MSAPATTQATSPSRLLRSLQSGVNRVRSRWRRTAVVIAGVILLGVAGYYFAFPHIRAYHHWRQVQAAADDSDFVRARTHLEICLQIWPDSPETHFHMARVCRRAGLFDDAKKQLAEAERLGFTRDEVALEQLLLQAQTGDIREVHETLVHYLQTGHRDELLIFEALVVGMLEIYHLPEAERWTTVWLERYPDDWRPYFYRARAFQLGRRIDRALEDYRQSLMRKPDAYDVRFGLGDALKDHGLLHEALPHLQYCYAQQPDDPALVVSLGNCHRMLGDSETARKLLDAWLEKHSQSREVGVLALRGRVERDLSDPEKALPWLRAAERIAPNNLATVSMLVNVLRELGQAAEADRYGRKLEDAMREMERLSTLAHQVSRDPDNFELRTEIGALLLRTGHKKNAIRWLMSAIDLNPAYAPAHMALAEYYDSIGDPEQARKHRLAAEGKLRVKP